MLQNLSCEKLQNIFQTMPFSFCIIKVEKKAESEFKYEVAYINQMCCLRNSTTEEKAVGLDLGQFIRRDEDEILYNAFAAAALEGKVSQVSAYNSRMCSFLDIKCFYVDDGYCGVIATENVMDVFDDAINTEDDKTKMAAEMSNNLVVDYNFLTKEVEYADKKNEFKKLMEVTDNFPESLIENGLIHEVDIPSLKKVFDNLELGAKNAHAVVRLKKDNGDFVWCRVTLSSISDANNKSTRAVGIIRNIDDIQRALMNLKFKAEMDSLTQLYTKEAVEAMVLEELMTNDLFVNHGVMIVDIDFFKSINDTKGRAYGDKMLVEIGALIKKTFRKTDIIGRLCDDEFIVFLHAVKSFEIIENKAKKLIKDIQSMTNDEIQVSASIGISVYPQHGRSFKALHNNATTALEMAKNKGVGEVCVYQQ